MRFPNNQFFFFDICACVLTVAVPSSSQAHFLWASLDPATKAVAIGLQEVPGQDPLPLGARAVQVTAWVQSGKTVPLKPDTNWLKGSPSDNCVGVSLDYGVIDRRDGGRGVFWLKYYAKGATTLGASQSILRLPVELTAIKATDGRPIITVLKDGRPASGGEVVVEAADGKTAFEGKTGSDGTVTLPVFSGPIEVRALLTDHVAGTHDGKPYDLVRSYSTLTVRNPSVEPLSRLLRDSFGNMHEEASDTAFINTVMAGSLTKPQLEAHLQQRALVHEAVDRVLEKAHVSPLPYGNSQREVISLLRKDLQSIGSSWPSRSMTWPLTQRLLDDIRHSGPYFALGVFHVYYGGITHGGRDIGLTIGKQLNVALTYYEKSGGYEEYSSGVDAITDPMAEQEMIRGADEAYRYIIAINNSEMFKAVTLKSRA